LVAPSPNRIWAPEPSACSADRCQASARRARPIEVIDVGSVIKKRRKKMRKHKQRKLLKRQRHKK
jgi:hypothetical protein